MPNAKDAPQDEPHRFFLYGDQGAGKTAQILTLPRPTFAYIFDPNSLLTLRGHDITYEAFMPSDLTLDVVSLKKVGPEGAQKHRRGPQVMNKKVITYENWEKDFDGKLQSGFFDDYNSIALDSVTSFLDLIMDYVLQVNGRPGQWPEQDDYGPQMVTFTNCMRTISSMGKTILCTGHYEVFQDRKTQRVIRQLMMTGRLRTKIPLLFSDIFYCEGNEENGEYHHTIQTQKDKDIPAARCSIKGLEILENVDIDWTQPAEGQGIGGILAWEQEQFAKEKKGGASKVTPISAKAAKK